MAIAEQKIINGVNVAAVEGLVNAIREKPELAKFKFRLHNKWHLFLKEIVQRFSSHLPH